MLAVDRVSKSFSRGTPPALDDVSFQVEKGSICGLLGHNGAGKSTLLGVMLGMVYPDRGEVLIDGISVQRHREPAMRKLGAIFEAPRFYEYLSGWKNLLILAAYSGKPDRVSIGEVVEWVGLTDRIRHRVGSYSHGMRQRLGLAQALIPQPGILLLDEPTDGLDPEGIVEFRNRLLELRDRLGLTVLLSSHLLSEVAQICDQVVILREGAKVFDGATTSLAGPKVVYRIGAENASPDEIAKACAPFAAELLPTGECAFPPDASPPDILDFLVRNHDFRITEFSPTTESLESLYLKLGSRSSGERPQQ